MQELFRRFAGNVSDAALLLPLANKLGVSMKSLQAVGVGINPKTGAYVIPERDEGGKVIGIMQRYPNGKKGMIKGSKRGLIYPVNQEGVHYESGPENWDRVGAGISCAVCGKEDGCLVPVGNPANPGACVCVHISEGSVKELGLGFLHILTEDGDLRSGHKGLLPPTEDPILVVEGHSDTIAALDLGFVAVGRSYAQGKTGSLKGLLKGKEVIIIGDNDAGAGKKGMEAVYRTLYPVCKSVIKILPSPEFGDLRQWKNETNLDKVGFLKWAEERGEDTGDPNVLDDDAPSTAAKMWLDQERTEDGLPTIRCYHGQFVEYIEGHYKNCDKDAFRGSIYRFLDGKLYSKPQSQGGVVLVPYKSTRSKISDVVDALSQWCPVSSDPPVWLKGMGLPGPVNLIPFQNGILDVNEYVQGRIKLYDPTPALFSFNALPYKFDEDARSKIWTQAGEDIFNGEQNKIKLLSEWFGYNCVPDMSLEKLMLCIGRPRSGKGTLFNALIAMLGRSQCVSTSFQTLCTEFGYQPLMGKLAALLSDAKVPKQGEAKAALEKILHIVGRDPIGVRRMYLSFLSGVYPTCRFSIAMNDLPALPDMANALEPKLLVLDFENSYEGREDITLKQRLEQEAKDGKLINFALEGLKRLRLSGKFTMPESALSTLKQLREITTPIASFIEDCCELQPPDAKEEYFVLLDHLFQAWIAWNEDEGRRPGLKSQFGRWFLTACPTAVLGRELINGRRYRAYHKVRLCKWVSQQYLGVSR